MRVKLLLSPLSRKRAKPEMRVGNAGPPKSKVRVQRDGVFVSSQSFARALVGMAILKKAALEIKLVRLDISRATLFGRLHFGLDFLFFGRSHRATGQLAA